MKTIMRIYTVSCIKNLKHIFCGKIVALTLDKKLRHAFVKIFKVSQIHRHAFVRKKIKPLSLN